MMIDTDAKDRILAAALPKFRNFGSRRVTMDDIATELRMSKKTLYRHFKSKRDLVRELVLGTLGMKIEAVRQALEDATGPEDAFSKSFEVLEELQENAAPLFMADVRSDYPEIWDEIDAIRTEVLRLYAHWVTVGVRSGVIREGISPKAVAGIMRAVLMNYLVPETFRDSDMTPREAITTWNIMLVSGLFKSPSAVVFPK